MATAMGLQPPPVFLPEPGTPPIPWRQWRELFITYGEAIDFDQFSDKKQRAILLNCLGAEGQKHFSKLPEANDYPPAATEYMKALHKIEKEFRQIKNKRAERYIFRKRDQMPGETISEYVAVLRDLASTCDFGDFLNDALCDQIIEKINNHKIRERLLAEEHLTLDGAIRIAKRLEGAIRDAKYMTAYDNGNTVSSVNI